MLRPSARCSRPARSSRGSSPENRTGRQGGGRSPTPPSSHSPTPRPTPKRPARPPDRTPQRSGAPRCPPHRSPERPGASPPPPNHTPHRPGALEPLRLHLANARAAIAAVQIALHSEPQPPAPERTHAEWRRRDQPAQGTGSARAPSDIREPHPKRRGGVCVLEPASGVARGERPEVTSSGHNPQVSQSISSATRVLRQTRAPARTHRLAAITRQRERRCLLGTRRRRASRLRGRRRPASGRRARSRR